MNTEEDHEANHEFEHGWGPVMQPRDSTGRDAAGGS
jgi:hypothetical protein